MRTTVFSLISLFISFNSLAQGFNPYTAYGEPVPQRSIIRTILNKITLTAASGVGYSFYSHELNHFTIANSNDRLYISPAGTSDYYWRWLNKPERTNLPVSTDAAVNTDSVSVGFKGIGTSIPLLISLHYQFDRFRIGAGASLEFHQFRKMEPTNYKSVLGSYTESFSSMFARLFGTFGGEYYRFYEYHYYLDIYAGIMDYGSGFDKSLMQKGAFINLGAPIEREFSEYFKVFLRPSYEFKSFSMRLPESPVAIKTRHQAFYINIGFRYNYPDIRRCPIRSCETQKVHTHKGRIFRGRPFYKKQNPQIGENYKHSPLFRKGVDKDAPKSKVKRRDPRK